MTPDLASIRSREGADAADKWWDENLTQLDTMFVFGFVAKLTALYAVATTNQTAELMLANAHCVLQQAAGTMDGSH